MGRLTDGAAAMKRPSGATVALLLVLAAATLAPRPGAASLLQNGALRDGSGERPTAWKPDAWSAEGTRFGWEPGEERGTLVLDNDGANDARWCQTVAVDPGSTYRVTAEVRTEDVGDAAAGAFLSIEPRIGHSRLLTGTNAWQPIDVTLRAGAERQWDVCVRLGSNGSLNTGRAWFRNIAMGLLMKGSPPPSGPSTLTRLSSWASQTSYAGVLIPLGAGALLAFGLGLFRR